MVRLFKAILTGLLMAAVVLEPVMAETMTVKAGYNLRMRPDGEIHHENDREQTVKVVERGNDWALVRLSSGKRYWVHASGLVEHNPDVASDNPGFSGDGGQSYKTLQDNWPIRSRPGTKTAGSTIIDYVSNDTPLVLLGSERDRDGDTWYKVKYRDGGRDVVGFVFEGKVRQLSETETEACDECAVAAQEDPGIGIIFGQAQDIAAVATSDAKGFHLGRSFHASCNKFISEDGLGEWGRHMVAAAKKIAPRCFYNDNVFDSVCPGYRSMNEERQNAFIALLFASIAEVESDCRPWAQAQGTNDLADGLFQLEYSARQRRRAGRNERWCRTTQAVDSQSLTFQSECAVSTIEDAVCARNLSITNSDGYWQKLRGNREITQILKKEIARTGLCN